MSVLVVLTTAPSFDVATAIGRTLVTEHLVACVNIVPGLHSIYQWEGAVQESSEHLLLLKTVPTARTRLEERLAALHPYAVPEFIVLEAEASAAFEAWVRAEARPR